LRDAFWATAQPILQGKLAESNSNIALSESNMAKAKGDIDNATNSLTASTDRRAAEWADIRGKYAQRTETMKQILGGLKVG
jgi:hypothetical protein